MDLKADFSNNINRPYKMFTKQRIHEFGNLYVCLVIRLPSLLTRKLSKVFRDNGMHHIKNPTRVTTTTFTLIHMYVIHVDRIVKFFVLVYGLSYHYTVFFVHKFRGKKSPNLIMKLFPTKEYRPVELH